MPSQSRFKALICMLLPVLKESLLLYDQVWKKIRGFSLTLPGHLSKILFRLKKNCKQCTEDKLFSK